MEIDGVGAGSLVAMKTDSEDGRQKSGGASELSVHFKPGTFDQQRSRPPPMERRRTVGEFLPHRGSGSLNRWVSFCWQLTWHTQ